MTPYHRDRSVVRTPYHLDLPQVSCDDHLPQTFLSSVVRTLYYWDLHQISNEDPLTLGPSSGKLWGSSSTGTFLRSVLRTLFHWDLPHVSCEDPLTRDLHQVSYKNPLPLGPSSGHQFWVCYSYEFFIVCWILFPQSDLVYFVNKIIIDL